MTTMTSLTVTNASQSIALADDRWSNKLSTHSDYFVPLRAIPTNCESCGASHIEF